MNLQEAWSILELPVGSDASAVKKKYRELTKKFHPDVNKDPGAEDKFKKINEAYKVASSGEIAMPQQGFQWGAGQPNYPSRQVESIGQHTSITFAESVLGTKRELKYSRSMKCAKCNGRGAIQQHNGCEKCGGSGHIMGRQGQMIFSRTCDKCLGKTSAIHCLDCQTTGVISVETSVTVSIPGGIDNEAVLRLGGMGNFAGSFMGAMDQYTDVFLKVFITPMEGLTIQGQNVISNITISLLEALSGCSKTVQTVSGDKTINIVPSIRNKDEVKIPHLGVNGVGDQLVIVNVEYPKDTSKLIELLNEKEN